MLRGNRGGGGVRKEKGRKRGNIKATYKDERKKEM